MILIILGASDERTEPAIGPSNLREPNRAAVSVRRANERGVAVEPPKKPKDIEVESPKASDRLQEEEAAQDRRHVWLAEQGWSLDQTHEYTSREANDHGLKERDQRDRLILVCQTQAAPSGTCSVGLTVARRTVSRVTRRRADRRAGATDEHRPSDATVEPVAADMDRIVQALPKPTPRIPKDGETNK